MATSTFGMLRVPTPFASADTVDIDANHTGAPDALDLLFPTGGDPLGFLSSSLTFPWEPNIEESLFTNHSFGHGLSNFHVHNEQPTPPPYNNEENHALSSLTASDPVQPVALSPNAPRKRQHKSHNGKEEEEKGGNGNCTIARRRKLHDTKTKTGSPHYLELTKRQKFLERNRMAASKCRQKKRERAQLLETRFEEQSERKNQLEGEISDLGCQILDIKNEVLKHAHCGDGHIERHLAQMIEQITCCEKSNKPKPTATAEAASPPAKPATLPCVAGAATS